MFYFINPVQVLMVMHPINNASRQVIFHKRIFPLTDLHFNDSTNLSPLLLKRIWCQIVPLWQKTFAQISHRMILGEGKTTKEKSLFSFNIENPPYRFKKLRYDILKVSTLGLLWRFCREQYNTRPNFLAVSLPSPAFTSLRAHPNRHVTPYHSWNIYNYIQGASDIDRHGGPFQIFRYIYFLIPFPPKI